MYLPVHETHRDIVIVSANKVARIQGETEKQREALSIERKKKERQRRSKGYRYDGGVYVRSAMAYFFAVKFIVISL